MTQTFTKVSSTAAAAFVKSVLHTYAAKLMQVKLPALIFPSENGSEIKILFMIFLLFHAL